MSDNPIKEVVIDLFQHLEALETQCAVLVHLVKEKGIGTEEEFARYAQQASEASSIKWRAARVRMDHLFASAPEPSEKASGAQTARLESGPQDQSKRDSGEAVEKGRKEAKAVGSSGKQSAERSQQPKASKGDSEDSGESEEKERPSQPSERTTSQSSEKPPREIRAEKKEATKTGSSETKEEQDQQGGEDAA